MSKLSQESQVLRMLQDNIQHGVENYKFPRMGILRYSARIGELRKSGHNIVAIRQVLNGRSTGVWRYYLNDEEVIDVKKKHWWSR